MRKKIIIMMILLLFISVMSIADTSKIIVPIKECSEPFDEYTYYLNMSKKANNSDMQVRYKNISDGFYSQYLSCKRGVKNNIINKSNLFRTFK